MTALLPDVIDSSDCGGRWGYAAVKNASSWRPVWLLRQFIQWPIDAIERPLLPFRHTPGPLSRPYDCHLSSSKIGQGQNSSTVERMILDELKECGFLSLLVQTTQPPRHVIGSAVVENG